MNRQDFENKVWNFIEENRLLSPGDGIVLGISGGADSVALLRFLKEKEKEAGFSIYCVHIEHGLRGEESLADAAFVRALSKSLEIPCKVISVGEEIAAITDTHASLEEKARMVRYKHLMMEAQEWERKRKAPVHIAVAHHADDNAETVLFHLARGTGLDGLRGIPVKRDRIVRPFLCVERKEIESYLALLQQDFCQDKTNQDVHYRRNRIRHEVLPLLEKVNQQSLSHINRTAFLVGEVAGYIHAQAKKQLESAEVKPTKEDVLRELCWDSLSTCPEFFQREVLHLWLQDEWHGVKDIGWIHLESLRLLAEGKKGKCISLPGGRLAWKTKSGIALGKSMSFALKELPKPVEVSVEKPLREERTFFYGDYCFCFRLRDYDGKEKIPGKIYTKWFDYDKIKNNIHIRKREKGDYLIISRDGATQKLQDYFVNEKVPASHRDEVPLLCEESHVIWVIGHRISEYYKVDTDTKHILEVQIIEERKHE